jgi:hypothetical protein
MVATAMAYEDLNLHAHMMYTEPLDPNPPEKNLLRSAKV